MNTRSPADGAPKVNSVDKPTGTELARIRRHCHQFQRRLRARRIRRVRW